MGLHNQQERVFKIMTANYYVTAVMFDFSCAHCDYYICPSLLKLTSFCIQKLVNLSNEEQIATQVVVVVLVSEVHTCVLLVALTAHWKIQCHACVLNLPHMPKKH